MNRNALTVLALTVGGALSCGGASALDGGPAPQTAVQSPVQTTAQAAATYAPLVVKVRPLAGQGLGVQGASVQGAAGAQACRTPSRQEVESLFDRWNDALQTRDAARVAANYAPGALLLPTVSNRPRVTQDGIKDYFAHWLEKGPEGEIVLRYISTGCNYASDAGVYRFTYDSGEQVLARYTYTYIYDAPSGQWLIAVHHSSAMPQDLTKEAAEEF